MSDRSRQVSDTEQITEYSASRQQHVSNAVGIDNTSVSYDNGSHALLDKFVVAGPHCSPAREQGVVTTGARYSEAKSSHSSRSNAELPDLSRYSFLHAATPIVCSAPIEVSQLLRNENQSVPQTPRRVNSPSLRRVIEADRLSLLDMDIAGTDDEENYPRITLPASLYSGGPVVSRHHYSAAEQ